MHNTGSTASKALGPAPSVFGNLRTSGNLPSPAASPATDAHYTNKRRHPPLTGTDTQFMQIEPVQTHTSQSSSSSQLDELVNGMRLCSPDVQGRRADALPDMSKVRQNRNIVVYDFMMPEPCYTPRTLVAVDGLQNMLERHVRPEAPNLCGAPSHYMCCVSPRIMWGVKTCVADFCRVRGIRMIVVHGEGEFVENTFEDLFDFLAHNEHPTVVVLDRIDIIFNATAPECIHGSRFWAAHDRAERRFRARNKLCGTSIRFSRFNALMMAKTWLLFSMMASPQLKYNVTPEEAKLMPHAPPQRFLYTHALREHINVSDICVLQQASPKDMIAFMKDVYAYHLAQRGVAVQDIEDILAHPSNWDNMYTLCENLTPGTFLRVFDCAFQQRVAHVTNTHAAWRPIDVPDVASLTHKLRELSANQ